jgi:DNA processing protein
VSAPDAERVARATLSVVVEPGDTYFLERIASGGAEVVLHGIRHHPEISPRYAAAQVRLAGVDGAAELARAHQRGIRFVVPGDEEWPSRLDDLAHCGSVQERGGVPVGLWVAGPLPLTCLEASVAVVGCRDSTTYGDLVAVDIAAGLADAGFTVLSGAALGIDYAAHRGAVAGAGPTVAVLACGVDRDYPPRHSGLLRHLRAEGAVISEVPLGGAPQRIRFLARNRLIAALSLGTVVVEAAARSGALNTLNWAQRLNRATMGVPGPVTSAASVGVHHQLRSGGASLVTCDADVRELVAAMGDHLTTTPRGPERPRDQLTLQDQQILDAVPAYRSAPAGSIARVAGISVETVEAALVDLEEAGLVEGDVGGWRLAGEEPARLA